MSFAPGYGETPVSEDEANMLLSSVRELLGDPVGKAAVYDLEQAVQAATTEDLVIAVIDGSLDLDELLTDYFLRDLHGRLYGDIWSWAGSFRRRELNIGVAPEHIAVDLRSSLETIRYRWQHTEDWSPRQLGIAAHAETVRIHPFTDGNGRTTRLLADLVYAAAQNVVSPDLYDWDLEKQRYIELLRQYDRHRNPIELAAYVGTKPLGE
ncbi:Fic family protein [Nocardia sp. NPDC003963]